MEAEKAQFPITVMCQVLNISPSGYHAWRRRPESRRASQDRQVLAEIRAVHQARRQTYGSPRVHAELRAQGRPVGRHRVARLMRQSGLQARRRRRYRQTTHSQHPPPIADNVLKRQFTVEHPHRAWVADITYLWTLEGWLYLSVILALYSRRVIGWAMGPPIDTALALRALHMALANRPVGAGLVHHSDRGSQYASRAYRAVRAAQGITASMSRAGDCWDNAVAESFFATLKVEGLQQTVFPTRAAARPVIFEYMEGFYNPRRRHSSLGYRSPVDYER